MSKIWYDHLIILEEIGEEIDSATETHEEKHEMWRLVDEIVHHKVMHTTLKHLPREHHEDFLGKFHEAPHNEGLVEYLNEKIGKNIEDLIRQEIGDLAFELLEKIKGTKQEE
mgnify:CR=1 FL=1